MRSKTLEIRIRAAKEAGATEEDLTPLKELLLYEPLDELGGFQDGGLITDVTLLDDDDAAKGKN